MYDCTPISPTQRVLRLLHDKPELRDYTTERQWEDYFAARDEYESLAVDMYDMVCGLADEFGAVTVKRVIPKSKFTLHWQWVIHPSLRGYRWQCTLFDDMGPVGDIQADGADEIWDEIGSDYIVVSWE